jgi:hypothetical protein
MAITNESRRQGWIRRLRTGRLSRVKAMLISCWSNDSWPQGSTSTIWSSTWGRVRRKTVDVVVGLERFDQPSP